MTWHRPREDRRGATRRRRSDGASRASAGFAALTLALAACTAAPSDDPAQLSWGDCSRVAEVPAGTVPESRAARLHLGCATLSVPLDPTGSRPGEVVLQLVRVHQDGGAESKAPLLLIAGGPGQSGVGLATVSIGLLPETLLDRFDVVGFDQRGVGRSRPIRCANAEDERPAFPDLLTDAGYQRAAATMRSVAEGCASALGTDAPHFSTATAAADIDRIRTALGQPTLTYLGWSYGAKLGAEYARQFPDRVRAAVLDSPTNPTTSWIETAERQIAGFESTFDTFVAWCTARSQCTALGDVRQFVAALVARAEVSPIPSGRPGDVVATNGVEVVDAVASALYDDARWPDLAAGLAEAADGDSGTLRDLIDAGHAGEDDQAGDAQYVINCSDSAPGPAETEIRAAAARVAARYPLFGVWGSWQLVGCTFWTPQRHPLRPPVAATSQPILVVGTRQDPATPYSGAVAMASSLGNAHLLTWEGSGHGAVGRNACITRLATEYLTTLTLPPPQDSTCPA